MAEIRPIEQTVFEQAPQATFVPPAQQPQVYQEDKVVFMEPIYSIDPGIAWYALGAEAAKTASTMFANTLDYLIDSKANALTDLSDMYRSQLDAAYVKLSKASKVSGNFNDETKYAKSGKMDWKDVKVRPSTSDSIVTDGILEEIARIKDEWKTKANKVLENGQSNWYTPNIDYWDENLPSKMDQYGIKWQQLAVAARKADRTIMDQAEKLLFESQFTTTASGKKETNAVLNKAINGLLPLATSDSPIPKRKDNTTMFHEVGPSTGQEVVQSINGMPIIVSDDNGFIRFNPSIPAKAIWRGMNPDDFMWYAELEQTATPDSALYSDDGRLTPMVSELAIEYFETPETTRDPLDAWKLGAVFAKLPPNAVANFVRTNKLTETDATYLSFAADSARVGQRPEDLSKYRAITPDTITESNRLLGTLVNPEIGMSDGTQVSGATVQQTDILANKVIIPIIGQLAGLAEDEQEGLTVNVTGFGRVVDTTPNETFSTFFQRNPALKVTALKALAYFKSNPSLIYDENGRQREDEDIKKSVESFIKTETNRAGLVTLRDPKTNQPTTFYNPNASWIGLKYPNQMQNLGKTMMTFATAESTYYPEGVNLGEIDYGVAKSTFGSSVDRGVFSSIHGALSYSVSGKDNIRYNTEGLPQSEVLRLAVASHPDTWKQYGWNGVDTLTEEQKEDFALQAYSDILPATEWDITSDFSMRHEAYMGLPNGGIPLGFTKIPTKSGKNLFDSVVPSRSLGFSTGVYVPENSDNTPVLTIRYNRPSPYFDERISTNFGLSSQGVLPYQLELKDNAPATKQQSLPQVLSQVSEIKPIKNFDYVFTYVKDEPLTTSKNAYAFINLNRETIKQVAQRDDSITKGVIYLLDDFGKANKDRKLFTEDNLKIMFEDAKVKGVKTALDFANYVVNVANATVNNRENKSPRKPIENIVYGLTSMGLPINFDENSFFVPTPTDKEQLSSYSGLVLFKPNTPEFFEGIKKYSMSGYNVYVNQESNAGLDYYLFKPGEPVDDFLTLVLPAKTENETADDYMVKYNQIFGQRETDVQRTKRLTDKVSSTLFAQPETTVQPSFKRHSVLPSYMQSAFTYEMNNFMARNNINFDNTDNLTDVLDVALFYDLPKLFYETGSLPQTIKDLPQEYRLPGHSKLVKTEPVRKSVPRRIMQGRMNAEDMARRSYQLRKAYENGNLNQAIDAVTEDPVAKLRTMDEDLTQTFNQDALNILLLAFEKNSEQLYKPEFETQYGVTKESFDKARSFAQAGWSPAAFEYQIRTLAKGLKPPTQKFEMVSPKNGVIAPVKTKQDLRKEQVTSSFNGLVRDIDPSKFLIDETIAEKLILDLQTALPSGRSRNEARDIVNDLIAHPDKALDLKQEYLMVSLLPQARDSQRSTRDLKAIGVARRIWGFYNKK